MTSNAEFEVSNEMSHTSFDHNAHINRVNAAYIANKPKTSHKFDFHSSPIGAKILNAVDGTVYNYKVGSFDEKRFWRVMVNNGKETAKLFYNNPEQYEQHRRTTVPDEEKTAWKHEQELMRREEIGLENDDLTSHNN